MAGRRRPFVLGKPELGQRVPALLHGLGADQEHQQIAAVDSLAQRCVIGIAVGELGAVEEDLVALRAQRQGDLLCERALLGGIRDEDVHKRPRLVTEVHLT